MTGAAILSNMQGSEAERRRSVPSRLVDRDSIPLLMDCEKALAACDRRLEELIHDLAMLADADARAQAEWEEHRDNVYRSINNAGLWRSEALAQAEAKGLTSKDGVLGADLYAAHLIMKGALKSARDSLDATKARSSSQQSLLKHLRSVTGLE